MHRVCLYRPIALDCAHDIIGPRRLKIINRSNVRKRNTRTIAVREGGENIRRRGPSPCRRAIVKNIQ